MFMSAGTDCHKDKKTARKISYDNINISEDIIKNWL